MRIVVACRCGQHFATDSRHLGKQVPCSACGASLTIAAVATPPPAPRPQGPPALAGNPAPQGIRVLCACGWAFSAPLTQQGRTVACPGCRGAVVVPPSDPLGLEGVLTPDAGLPAGWLQTPPASDRLTEQFARRLAYIAAASVGLLALAMVVTSLVNVFARQYRELPNASAATSLVPTEDAAKSSAAPVNATKGAPQFPTPLRAPEPELDRRSGDADAMRSAAAPEATSTGTAAAAGTPTASPATTQEPNQLRATERQAERPSTAGDLPEATRAWLEQPDARLGGIRRVGSVATPGANFSWLTGLLPFLGHQGVFDRIDFRQSVNSGANIKVAATSIPEFLNPLDDRTRWQGYPFHGLALTHFAGMSGVEDARNVVAAKLPRSDPRAGIFGYDEVARPAEITDGTSQTIMLVGTGALANPWMFGGGGTIRGAREPLFDRTTGLGMKGLAGGGTLAVMADGSVREVNGKVDPRVFKALCTIRGAEQVDVEQAAPSFAVEQWQTPARGAATVAPPSRRAAQN